EIIPPQAADPNRRQATRTAASRRSRGLHRSTTLYVRVIRVIRGPRRRVIRGPTKFFVDTTKRFVDTGAHVEIRGPATDGPRRASADELRDIRRAIDVVRQDGRAREHEQTERREDRDERD